MKKLMIAASAALCATVGFSLESANVVGYQNLTPDAGYKNMFGISFNQVGGSGCDIQDIVCKNGTAAPGDSEFRMWWYDLDQLKYVYAVYSASGWADDGMDDGYGTEYSDKLYWVSDDDDLFIYAPLGWKHDAEAPATIVDHEKRFAAGEGFFIQPNGALANPVVTISGEVLNVDSDVEEVAVELEAGFKNLVASPFPVSYDIQDVRCYNKSGDKFNNPGDSEFRMWWYDLDQLKYVYAVYSASGWADDGMDEGYGTEYADKFYWVSDDDDLFIYAPLGWKHDAEAPATIVDHEKRFAAGEGFFIQPNGALSNPIVTFKNPFND